MSDQRRDIKCLVPPSMLDFTGVLFSHSKPLESAETSTFFMQFCLHALPPTGVVLTALPQMLIFFSEFTPQRALSAVAPEASATPSSAAAPSALSSPRCLTHSLCAEPRTPMCFCSVVRPTLDLRITGEAQRGDAGGSGLVCMRPVSLFYLPGFHLLSLLSPRGAPIHEGCWGRGGVVERPGAGSQKLINTLKEVPG